MLSETILNWPFFCAASLKAISYSFCGIGAPKTEKPGQSASGHDNSDFCDGQIRIHSRVSRQMAVIRPSIASTRQPHTSSRFRRKFMSISLA